MPTVVYSSEIRTPIQRLISPYWIARHLMSHRELIAAFARREFQATHRDTYLGMFWSLLTPLIMLALFTLVFGIIFKGKFSGAATETPTEFAIALFVGLSFYNCIGQALTGGPQVILANSIYVKTLSFPVEILPLAAIINILKNFGISIGLCMIAFIAVHGYVHWTSIFVVIHIACVSLLSLGLCWFLSSLAVFVRDTPAVTGPISMVLMFLSSVFFPIGSVPGRVQWLFKVNPVAIIIDDARGCLLYGRFPALLPLAVVLVISVAVLIFGYWFFMRTKPAFADVI